MLRKFASTFFEVPGTGSPFGRMSAAQPSWSARRSKRLFEEIVGSQHDGSVGLSLLFEKLA